MDCTVTILLEGKELARVRVVGSDNPVSDIRGRLQFNSQREDELPVLDMRPQAKEAKPILQPSPPWKP